MSKYFNISFVGSGNVAWHLAPALENLGHSILEVYSRSIDNAQKLCSRLYDAKAKADLNFEDSGADVIILAVSDKVIPLIIDEIILPRKCVVAHTSGTESIESLGSFPEGYGVLYPIQTFSKGREVNFKNLPFSIEASDGTTKSILATLATSLSNQVFFHTTPERRVIHLASVFASNFTNHMYTISKGLLESNGLKFDLVKPLIEEVVKKAFQIGPERAQTGPAIRGDYNTIDRHLSYLSEEEDLEKIYQLITNNIIKTYEE